VYSIGPSCQVEVGDAMSLGYRNMSLKDWMAYYEGGDHDSCLTMRVELSQTKLEKCIELPNIVCSAVYFGIIIIIITRQFMRCHNMVAVT